MGVLTNHRLECVDSVLVSSPVKVDISHAIGVDITTILVTNTIVAIATVVVATFDRVRATE